MQCCGVSVIPRQRHTPHPLQIRSLLLSYSGVHRDLSIEVEKTQVGYNHPRTREGEGQKGPRLTDFPLLRNLGDANFPTIFRGSTKDSRQDFTSQARQSHLTGK